MKYEFLKIEPISEEDRGNYNEIELLKKAKQGDKKSVETLLKLHFPFILSIVTKFEVFKENPEDVISNAILYYLKAIKKVDIGKLERKENKFLTYVAYYIKQGVFEFRDQNRQIALSIRYTPELFNKIVDLVKQGYSIEEIYNSLKNDGYNIKKWQIEMLYFEITNKFISLNDKFTVEDETTYEEFISNNYNLEKIILDKVFNEELKEIIYNILNSDVFNDREKDILKRRFGLDTDKQTLKEIAKDIGLSRERVRQIEHKALRKMRAKFGYKLKKILKEI